MKTRDVSKQCRFCGRFFCPDSRVGDRQKSCSDVICQKKRKRAQEQKWLSSYQQEHSENYSTGSYGRVAEWRKKNPEYQRQWRAKKRREIQTQIPPESPVKSMRIHLRLPTPLSEIQTQWLRLTRSGVDLWVTGEGMQDTNADSQAASP